MEKLMPTHMQPLTQRNVSAYEAEQHGKTDAYT